MKYIFSYLCIFFIFSSLKGYSQGSTCADATPFCTAVGTPFTYVNSTSGDFGSVGCLQTTPGPNWFFIKTTTPGTYIFNIQQSTTWGGTANIDVDFIAWGPYSSPQCSFASGGGGLTNDCSSIGSPWGSVEDCSYCWDPTETMTLRPTSNCQVYMIMVTNYSRTAGYITFTQTSGPATDCNITNADWIPPSPMCANSSAIDLNTLLSGTAGGTWSGPGVTGNTFDPAVAGVGVHSITYAIQSGLCPLSVTNSITVNAATSAVFTPMGPYCVGETPGSLPTTSNDGVDGTWNPSNISTATTGTTLYTFTPAVSQCAVTTTMSITVTSSMTPSFTPIGPYCVGATPDVLPVTSNEGIAGAWNPAAISTAATGTSIYTFTPVNSLCAINTTMIITISNQIIPNFSIPDFCAGSTPPVLGNTSPNGINGAWDPAVIDNTTSGTYTFIPDAGQCSPPLTLNLTVYQSPVITVSASPPTICAGSSTSLSASGAATYTWSGGLGAGPTVTASPQTTTTYIVTGSENGCPDTASVTVSVTSVTPFTVTGHNAGCGQDDGSADVNQTGGNNTYIWSTIPVQTSQTATNLSPGTYSVTITGNGCSDVAIVTIDREPGPIASYFASPTRVTLGADGISFSDRSTGNITQSAWYFGDGSYAEGINSLHNYSDTGRYLVVHIVRDNEGCVDTTYGYIYVISDFNFYIPNCFSPNYDGINDIFLPRGNGVDLDTYLLDIYNRWGQCIYESSVLEEGWNGTYKNEGKTEEALIDVYVYNITLRDLNRARHRYIGFVTIIK